MPYKRKDGRWVGQIRWNNTGRKQKVFTTDLQAIQWEDKTKEKINQGKKIQEERLAKIESIRISEECKMADIEIKRQRAKSLEEFKVKYRSLYQNPLNTIADIFDLMMKEVDIPVRYKDILSLAKKYKRCSGGMYPKLRIEILERDKRTCQWCGRKAPEVVVQVDHIIPISRGGLTERRNLHVLCRECNIGKSDTFFNKINEA